jgi:hypothetical protein
VEIVRGSATGAQAARLRELGVGLARMAEDRAADAVVVDLPDPNEVDGWWPRDRLVVFDDREEYRGAAAILVQPSLPEWRGGARADRVLEGFAYAPLRPALRGLTAQAGTPIGPREVIVCFGGSDPSDVSGRLVPPVAEAVAGIRDPGGTGSRTVAIVGPGYGGALRPGPTWTIERDPGDLDRRLAAASLALVGGGTMKLEVAALGVPAVVVAAADDQLPVGPVFAATGACRFLGDGRTIDPAIVASAVVELLGDDDARRRMSAAGRATVDGLGAGRIAAEVLALAATR